jgi:hypothetical protein
LDAGDGMLIAMLSDTSTRGITAAILVGTVIMTMALVVIIAKMGDFMTANQSRKAN